MDTQNSKNNFSNPVVLILVIALIGLGGYVLFSKNSNVPITQDTNENTQAPVVEQKIVPPAKTQVADQAALACDTAAKNYFNEYWTKPTAGTTIEKSYKNYYNKTSKTCYVLVKFYYNWQLIYSDVHWSYNLYDIYSKDPYGGPNQLGTFAQNMSSTTSYNEVSDCSVGGMKCFSLDGFMSLVQPYFSN